MATLPIQNDPNANQNPAATNPLPAPRPSGTMPMLSSDGQIGDVPTDRVPDAVKQGLKIGQDMLSPDGKHGTVPLDRVHEAIKAGFQIQGASPAAPQVTMQTSPAGNLSPAAEVTGDVATGALKGAGQTVGTVGSVINKIPVIGETLSPKAGVTALNQAATPTNTAQKVGTGAENIAEFFLGDEALKGLSIAERLGMGAKVAKLAESNPVIAKIIGHGLTAIRGGSVVTGQELAHGATPTQALETGATAAALGSATGAAVEGAGAIKDAYKSVLDTKSVQPVLQQGIRDTLAKVADENGVVKSAAPSIRDVAKETADAVYSKSKAQYQILDDATGGRVQRFKDRLDNIRQSLDSLTGTEEDVTKEAALLKAQKETEDAMQEAFKDARAKGVDPKLIDEATANFKKSQALYDLDKHLKMSASGMRPDVGTEGVKNPEAVDPSKMFSRINRLYDSGRLQEAVGQQSAENLLDHANNAYIQQQKILSNQAFAKTVAKYAVHAAELGTGGALAAHYVGHLF